MVICATIQTKINLLLVWRMLPFNCKTYDLQHSGVVPIR